MEKTDVKSVVKQEPTTGALKQKAVTFDANTKVKKEESKYSHNNTKRRKNKKNKSTEKKAGSTTEGKTAKSNFKGGETKMNGHVFQLHDESSTAGQFTRTKQEVERFVQSDFVYGHDIVYLLTMQEECDIESEMPEHPPDRQVPVVNADGNNKKDSDGKVVTRTIAPSAGILEIWKEEIKAFVTRRRTYKANKKSLWFLILGQCSLRLRAHLESMEAYKKMYLTSDCLWLLREIHKAMSRFEHTRYPPMSVADAYAKFFCFFQGTGMTDMDYMTKYQEFRDLFDHF